MDAAAGEGVEVAGKRGDEGFAFAGLHLGDLAGVEDHAADQLDVEVAHLDGALAGFADDGEGFGEDVVEGGFFGGDARSSASVDAFDGGGDALAEFGGLGAELLVGERLDGGLEVVDLPTIGIRRLTARSLLVPEDFSDDFVEQNCVLRAHFSAQIIPTSSLRDVWTRRDGIDRQYNRCGCVNLHRYGREDTKGFPSSGPAGSGTRAKIFVPRFKFVSTVKTPFTRWTRSCMLTSPSPPLSFAVCS